MESHTKMHSFEGPKTLGPNDKPWLQGKKKCPQADPIGSPHARGTGGA